MGNFDEIIDIVAKNAVNKSGKSKLDYRKDGLMYCGKCHTPKEYRMKWVDGSNRNVPIRCKCEKDAEANRKADEQHIKDMKFIESLRMNSLMDEKFKKSKFASIVVTPENQKQVKIANRYVEKFDELYKKNQGLLFYGNTGTGKTHIACCIGNALIDNKVSVLATSFVKILNSSKDFKTTYDEDLYIRKMTKAKLLILDDLGAERSTDYALEIVYNIIDSRYRSGKPMIITTNLSVQEMNDVSDIRYRRIYDRIFEVCYPVEFAGKSWRMREAAKRFDDLSKYLED